MNESLYSKLMRLYAIEKAILGVHPKDIKVNILKLETDCDNLMQDIESHGEVLREMKKVRDEYTIT